MNKLLVVQKNRENFSLVHPLRIKNDHAKITYFLQMAQRDPTEKVQ